MSIGNNYIEIDVEVKYMTGDAIFLSDGYHEDWIPRSLIKDGESIDVSDMDKVLTLEVEEWIAIKKEFV